MDAIRYIALGAAVVVGLLCLVRPTWGLLGLVILLPTLNRLIPKIGPGLNAETFLFALALLGALIWMRPALPSVRDAAPVLAYVACTVFGFAVLLTQSERVLAQLNMPDWIKAVKFEIWPTLLFFAGYALAPTERDRRRVVGCLAIALALFVVNGLLDYATGAGAAVGYYRAAGALAKNPNILGGALIVLAAVPLVGMTTSRNSKRVRLSYAGLYALATLTLVLTQSRGAWLGFAVGHVAWLAFKNRRLLAPVLGTAILLFFLGAASLLPDIVSQRLEASTQTGHSVFSGSPWSGRFDTSIDSRITYHVIGAQMFLDSPLWGHGYHVFRLLAKQYGRQYGIVGLHQIGAESILLSVAVSYGAIGLAIMFWICWMLGSYVRSLTRKDCSEHDLGLILVYTLGGVGAMSLTLNALYVHEIALPFWLIVGISARAAREQRVARAAERRPAWMQFAEAPASA